MGLYGGVHERLYRFCTGMYLDCTGFLGAVRCLYGQLRRAFRVGYWNHGIG